MRFSAVFFSSTPILPPVIPHQLLAPYLLTNAVALALLALAYRRPRWLRWAAIVIFGVAGVFNAVTALENPNVYDDFSRWALADGYRRFIRGWFHLHAGPMVLAIALGQLLVAGLLLGPAPWRPLGIVGGVIFLVAIAPLGVGSAFPSSLVLALALLVMGQRWGR